MDLEREITTPIGNHKVVFKTMLTGQEREDVENEPNKYAETQDGKTFKVDLHKVAFADRHALLKVSVKSIDNDSTNILDRLLKMYEPDYEYVFNEIVATQKKMRSDVTSTPS